METTFETKILRTVYKLDKHDIRRAIVEHLAKREPKVKWDRAVKWDWDWPDEDDAPEVSLTIDAPESP